MQNLDSLVVAYIAVWVVFCGYLFTVSRRLARLEGELRRLKGAGK